MRNRLLISVVAALTIVWLSACKTANDRPAGGSIDYACDCGKKARADADAQMPICCGKSMKVTSTIKDRTQYLCADLKCGKSQFTDADVPAPSC